MLMNTNNGNFLDHISIIKNRNYGRWYVHMKSIFCYQYALDVMGSVEVEEDNNRSE